MNARLPKTTNPIEDLSLEGKVENPKTPEQERASLSLDIREQTGFEDAVEQQKEAGKQTAEQIEKGEKPKAFDWMTVTTNAALFGVGAYSMYKIGSWATAEVKEAFFDEEPKEGESKKENPFPFKSTVALAVATGVALKEKSFLSTIKEWFEKLWNLVFHNDMFENLGKFFKTVQEKGIKAAYEELTYDTDEPFIQVFSEEIDIEKRHLAELQPVSYEKFLSARKKDNTKSYLTKAMDFMHFKVEDIPFTDADDELRRVGQEDRLAAFIEAHKGEVGVSDEALKEMTIGDILKKILAQRGTKTDPSTPKEGHEASPEGVVPTIVDDPEKAKDEMPESAKAIAYANEHAKSKEEYAVIVTEGALKDGASLVQTEWGTFIAKGATGILISSGTMMTEEFKNAGLFVYNMGKGDTHSAAGNVVDAGVTWYENGGVWFLVGGMGLGAAASVWNGESIVAGMTKGGLRGALLGPVGTLWNAVKAAKAGEKGIAKVFTEADYRLATAHSGVENTRNFFTKKGGKMDAYKAATDRHIKEYERYFELRQRARSGQLKNMHIGRLDSLQPEHLERMELYHFTQVRNNWIEFQKAKGVSNPKFPFDLDNFTDDKTEVDEFIQKFREENGLVSATRTNVDDTKARLTSGSIDALPANKKIEALKQSSKEADEYMQTAIKKMEEMKVEGKPQSEIDDYAREVKTHLGEVRERYKAIFEDLKANSRSLSKEDQIALKALLKTELSHASGVRGIIREVGERSTGKLQLVFGVAAIGLEYFQTTEEEKEAYAAGKIYEWKTKFGLNTLQIIADVLSPFGVSDWYTVATGNEFFTGEKASTWNRFTRVIFGAYNLGTDALAAIGGAATAEVAGAGGAAVYGTSNTLEGALRAAGKSPEVIAAARTIVPEVQGLAKALGGYQEFFRVMKNVAGKGMLGVGAVEVGLLGKELIFDTKDQEPMEIELPKAVDEEPESVEGEGEEEPAPLAA